MINPNHNDPSQQKRLLIALVVSFVFFLAYDYFFIPKQTQNVTNAQNATQVANQNPAPSLNHSPTPDVGEKPSGVKAPMDALTTIATVEAPDFTIQIDTLGRMAQMTLKNKDIGDTKIIGDFVRPLELRFSDGVINNQAFNVKYTAQDNLLNLNEQNPTGTLVLEQKLDNLIITKTITIALSGAYTITVDTSKPTAFFMTPGFRPDAAVDQFAFHGTLLKTDEDTLELIDDGDVSEAQNFTKSTIVASADKYFTTLFYDFEQGLSGVVDRYQDDNGLIFVAGQSGQTIKGYIGPKHYKQIKAIDKRLTDVIEYGFITFFAKPMFSFLSYIHSYVGNWGWAIVILTFAIRIVLYPLTYKGMVSMNRIKELAPKVKEIQEKYKGNPQQSGAKMMELYKKHNANPMGGCLPFILQIPVFFAIYRTLLNAIELKGSAWMLWINDLAVQDPYFILPILMGGSMYLQQLLTPNTITDPMQQKIFKFLPLIFTVFFLTFPSGLVLYWFVNNLFSIAQQYYINSLFEKKKNATGA